MVEDKTYEPAATQLLPRAVGDSAALLGLRVPGKAQGGRVEDHEVERPAGALRAAQIVEDVALDEARNPRLNPRGSFWD
jgi:hypothetical protein